MVCERFFEFLFKQDFCVVRVVNLVCCNFVIRWLFVCINLIFILNIFINFYCIQVLLRIGYYIEYFSFIFFYFNVIFLFFFIYLQIGQEILFLYNFYMFMVLVFIRLKYGNLEFGDIFMQQYLFFFYVVSNVFFFINVMKYMINMCYFIIRIFGQEFSECYWRDIVDYVFISFCILVECVFFIKFIKFLFFGVYFFFFNYFCYKLGFGVFFLVVF